MAVPRAEITQEAKVRKQEEVEGGKRGGRGGSRREE